MPIALLIDLILRWLIVAALLYVAVVAVTHWAVRSRRISPFGAWPRFVRKISDPIMLPLERRIIRMGGNPQTAPLWLLGLTVVAGLLLISVYRWAVGFLASMSYMAHASPQVWLAMVVSWIFTILIAAIFIRVIASWIGLSYYSRWMRPVMLLTNWLVEPLRRIVPPMGMFDLSPLVAWLILIVARRIIISLILGL